MKSTHRPARIAALVLMASAAGSAFGQVSRTPWQMNEGEGVIKLDAELPSNGALPENNYIAFKQAQVPAEGKGWVAAPNPETIGFGNASASKIAQAGGVCRKAVDYTYFQTFVEVPAGTRLDEFKISFQGMDDASRITIFNSKYPKGQIVAGSYVLRSAPNAQAATTDLKSLVTTGRNRVVITQVDWCPVGNQLQSAQVLLNGSKISTGGTTTVSHPVGKPAAPAAPAGRNLGLFLPGEKLKQGSGYAMSGHLIIFQQDGNLCIYKTAGNQFVWCVNNDPKVQYQRAKSVELTTDGRLRMTDAGGSVIWQTPANNPQVRSSVHLTDNGTLELRAPSGNVVWSSR